MPDLTHRLPSGIGSGVGRITPSPQVSAVQSQSLRRMLQCEVLARVIDVLRTQNVHSLFELWS